MRELRSWSLVALLTLLPTCTGRIDEMPTAPRATATGNTTGGRGGSSGGGTGAGGTTTEPGPATPAPTGAGRLRRLTRAQLENSLRDLLGPVEIGATPENSVDSLPSVGSSYDKLTDSAVDQYHAAMKQLLTGYFADPNLRKGLLAACGATPAGDPTCARKVVTSLGHRAWRRPLTDAEITRYTEAAVAGGAKLGDPYQALMYATLGLLTSPNFLYRVELGVPEPTANGRYRFTSLELASRLGFFLTGSTPDAALLAAGEANELDTPEGVRAQATRLIQSERGKAGITSFARELFLLDQFLAKPTEDPRYTASLRRAMADEAAYLFRNMLTSGSDAFELFDSKKALVTDELAKIYGIPGITSKTGVEALLPDSIPRAGILGRGVFLAGSSSDKVNETAPVNRGLFIAEQVLCREVPPPPPGIEPKPVPAGQVLTKREQLELHRADPGCAACHAVFDQLGLAFENLDWVGQHRDKEPNGKTVDTTGTFDGEPFRDSRELASLLRKAPDAQRCFVRNLFRYAVGHLGNRSDDTVIDGWNGDFGKSGRDLSGFLTAMVASDGFRFVSPAPSQSGQAADARPAPGSGTAPGTQTGPTNPVGPTDLAAQCQRYCTCMSKGACSGRLGGDCMSTCMKEGSSWALGCRTDKCQIAQSDYRDQITGDCLASIGVNACFDK
jgi:hypothetical protein